jgi:hypothetical protein
VLSLASVCRAGERRLLDENENHSRRASRDVSVDSIFIVNRDREIQYARAISAERFGVLLLTSIQATLT